MLWLFILGSIVAVIGIVCIVLSAGKRSEDAAVAKIVGWVAWLLGVVLMIIPCVTTVDARAVAIQTSFGKYSGTTGPGLQLQAPWTNTEEWTTRPQTSEFNGAGADDDRENYFHAHPVDVKIVAEQPTRVDLAVEWNITEKSVKELWTQYKTFETARRNFVDSAIRQATVDAFAGYDPFTKMTDPTKDPERGTNAQFATLVERKLREQFATRGIELKAVRITNIDYGDKIDQALEGLTIAVQQTRIAEQNKKTAEQDSQASQLRSAGRPKDCVSLVLDLAAQDKLKDLPAGWQCPETAGAPPVIVGSR